MPTGHPILVADTAESIAVFRRTLAAPHPVITATTLEQAKAGLADGPGLIVCGCHFDEGRMYDLLRHAKAEERTRRIPFLAVRCVEGELIDDTLYESVKIAVRALGGNAFVDLPRWQRRWGVAEASLRLTHLVDTLLSSTPPDTE